VFELATAVWELKSSVVCASHDRLIDTNRWSKTAQRCVFMAEIGDVCNHGRCFKLQPLSDNGNC